MISMVRHIQRNTRRSLTPLLLIAYVVACQPATSRDAPDTTGGRGIIGMVRDSVRTPIASDATLSILSATPLSDAIGVAADSFAVREAVRIVHERFPSPASEVSPTDGELPDIVVLADSTLDALFIRTEQARWYLPFARERPVIVAPDTAAATGRDSSVRRRLRGRAGARAPRDSVAAPPPPPPRRYALTIPRRASNPALAERFVRYLFSDEGRRVLLRAPLDLVDPLTAIGSEVPAAVAAVADSIIAPR